MTQKTINQFEQIASLTALDQLIVRDPEESAAYRTKYCTIEQLATYFGANLTLDADLTALANNTTDGFWARTGLGTGAARTFAGTANEITVTNGSGSGGHPTISLPSSITLTGKTLTGGTFAAIAGLTASGDVKPTSSDGAALGTSSLMWSDLFLASGAVVNFNNGDITLTHSADTLTLAGGVLALPASGLSVNSLLFNGTDAGFDVLYGWDDSAAKYQNFSLASLTDEGSPTTGDYVLIYGAEGDLRKTDWANLPGAGSGAPTTAQYVCLATDGGLSAERVLTAGTGIGITDAGANGNVTVAISHLGIQSLTDPNADRILFWDDSAGAVAWLTPSGLTITTTSIAVDAATSSASGIAELATAAETTTGTDAARVVTPDGLAGSDFGKKVIQIAVTDPNGAALTTGDGKAYLRINSVLNGYNLVAIAGHVTTVSSSGAVTVQLHNVTDAVDILSTALTIDANEKDSATAATPAVINASNDDVATADEIRIDIDGAGTGAKGLIIELTYQLP